MFRGELAALSTLIELKKNIACYTTLIKANLFLLVFEQHMITCVTFSENITMLSVMCFVEKYNFKDS